MWDTSSGTSSPPVQLQVLTGHTGYVSALCLSPDGATLYSAGVGGGKGGAPLTVVCMGVGGYVLRFDGASVAGSLCVGPAPALPRPCPGAVLSPSDCCRLPFPAHRHMAPTVHSR